MSQVDELLSRRTGLKVGGRGRPPIQDSTRDPQGLVYQRLAQQSGIEVDGDKRDAKTARRASRLRVLIESEVWSEDLVPLFHEIYDSALGQVAESKLHPDAMKALQQFVHALDKTFELGRGAGRRWAARRYQLVIERRVAEEKAAEKAAT